MNARAFTLLETIVALSVFAIAVVGCLRAIHTITGVVAGLRQESEARRSLENHALKIRGTRPFPTRQPVEEGTLANGIDIQDEIAPVIDEQAGITKDERLLRVRSTASWTTRWGRQSTTNVIYVRGTD